MFTFNDVTETFCLNHYMSFLVLRTLETGSKKEGLYLRPFSSVYTPRSSIRVLWIPSQYTLSIFNFVGFTGSCPFIHSSNTNQCVTLIRYDHVHLLDLYAYNTKSRFLFQRFLVIQRITIHVTLLWWKPFQIFVYSVMYTKYLRIHHFTCFVLVLPIYVEDLSSVETPPVSLLLPRPSSRFTSKIS